MTSPLESNNFVSMEKTFIAIAGPIAAGKTTLAEKLSQVLKLPLYKEEVTENLYLEDFYKDMEKYSFPLQIYLLNRRFKQHQQVIWAGEGGIQDRSIYEDAVFAKCLKDSNLMAERDYNTYLDLFGNMSNFMRKPNLIIYLSTTAKICHERIEERGREMEKDITLEYLQTLIDAYRTFINEISKVIPVIEVHWDEFHDVEAVALRVQEEYEKMRTVHTVDW